MRTISAIVYNTDFTAELVPVRTLRNLVHLRGFWPVSSKILRLAACYSYANLVLVSHYPRPPIASKSRAGIGSALGTGAMGFAVHIAVAVLLIVKFPSSGGVPEGRGGFK